MASHEQPALWPTHDRPPTLEELFTQHAEFVARVAMRILGRDAEVDDVVQEVFLSALSDLDRLRNVHAVRGWLKTVTVRKAMRLLTKRRMRRWLGLDAQDVLHELAAPGCSPEQCTTLLRVYRLLDELPVGERMAWTLRHVEGEQVEAVAMMCGCSLATVKRRIAAAQSFLERTLSDG